MRRAGSPELIVLQSFATPKRQTNPYLVELLRSLPEDVVPVCFSWRFALLGRFDVVHMHWPEVLLRGADRRRTWARELAFALFLLRMVLRRTALVRTLHNIAPHEPGPRTERLLQRWCDRLTTVWVRLTPVTPSGARGVTVTIPHGHYRDWFQEHAVPAPVPGRVLHFGLVRPYKGVDALLSAFTATTDADLSLRIVGKPVTAGLAGDVEAACQVDQRASAVLRYVDDGELAHEVGEAELVVLPAPDMHNSGSLLLSLSLGRPVLVPATPANREIAAEVGADWVMLYDGRLDAAALEWALAAWRARGPTAPPDLARRDWHLVGAQHQQAYLLAKQLKQRRRS